MTELGPWQLAVALVGGGTLYWFVLRPLRKIVLRMIERALKVEARP